MSLRKVFFLLNTRGARAVAGAPLRYATAGLAATVGVAFVTWASGDDVPEKFGDIHDK